MKKVISIGKLELRKRPTDFIEIARDVIRLTTEEVSFFWIGEGDLLENCKRMTDTETNIQFLGYVSEVKKKSFLETCDVYISTSEHEGFNMPIGEALLLKKPIIAYALPVYREIYNNFVQLVPLNKRSKFVQEIIRVLENPTKEISEKACAFVQENYSAEAIRKRLLKILHTLIHEKS